MKSNYFAAFLKNLDSELEHLPYSYQLAFFASCCERAIPNYESFSESENWGDAAALRSSLDAVWRFAIDRSEADWPLLLSRCKTATPDSDTFHPKTAAASVLITAGQEAAFMVALLLEFCRDQNLHHATEIATFARDTVDRQIQVIEKIGSDDPKLEERIAKHSLMLQEFEKQKHDLSTLTRMTATRELFEFQRYAVNPRYSNIGLKSHASPLHS